MFFYHMTVLDFGRCEVRASRALTWKIYRANHFICAPEIRGIIYGHSVDQNLASHKGTVMQLIEGAAVNLGGPHRTSKIN